MRYVPVDQLEVGMVLASPLYGNMFEVLLGEGMVLTRFHIQRIKFLGYTGVYITDKLSEGIRVRDVLPHPVRLATIKAARELWRMAEQGEHLRESAKTARVRQDRIVMPVIESLISNPRRIVELVDVKPEDDYLYYHAANVAVLSTLIGVEMGLSGTQLYELALSSLLHDVGNIFVPKELLTRPGKLTDEEYAIVQSHTQLGFEYLRDNFDISIEGCMGALQHHENYDGSGYPNGLRRDKISIFGRIIAITDVYDALTSRRPFRRILFPSAAMDYLEIHAGALFDPEIVEVFRQVTPLYPSGFPVELSTGEQGIVVQNFPGDPERPCVRVTDGKSGQPCVVDLHGDPSQEDIYISHVSL